MSHTFIFICCCGFYFDIIGYLELHFIFIFYVYKSKFNIMSAVSFFYSNLSPRCFPLSLFQGKFFSIQGQWPFLLFPQLMIIFSMKFIDFLIAHKCDHLFVLLLPLVIQSQAFVFSPFGGWHCGSVP